MAPAVPTITGGPVLLLLLAIGCSKPPPYTPQECELAREFAEACWRYNSDIDEGKSVEEISTDTTLRKISQARDNLAVSKERKWKCGFPTNANNYTFTPHFQPTAEACGIPNN